MERLFPDDQLFNLMLGEFPANFTDRNGFGIEPPHSLINNYTTQEFNAIRSNVIKMNNDSQLSTLLRFHVEQHKRKRLEFYNSIRNEYGDAEKEIKARHDELELLKLCGFDENIDRLINEDDELIMKEGKMVKESMNNKLEAAEILEYDKKVYGDYCSKSEMYYNQLQLDHELIKVSQQRQHERLKKLHSFILGKVEPPQSTSPVTSVSDNPLCMKPSNEKGDQQNSIAEQPSKIIGDQDDVTILDTSIKNNDDSVQPDILSKQFKAFKFNQKKFAAKKDILSMECISGKQTTQPSDLSSSLQSNQLESKLSNFDDRHLPTSPSSSTSWGGRSKYSYYSSRSKPIMERNVDYPSYSNHYYRRPIIKPRPYRKIRPYDNRYHRVFPPFRSEIKSFNPTYSHKVWKNDYTYSKFSDSSPKFSDSSPKFSDLSSKFPDPPLKYSDPSSKYSDPSSKFSDPSPKYSDRYIRDKDSISVGDSSTQHTDRFSASSSSFINNLPNSESTLPESSHQSSNNPNLISKSRSGTDIDPMELDNNQQNTTPASSTTLTNHSTTSNNNTDKKQFSLDISSFIPSEAMSLLDDKMSINGDNGDSGLNTIQKNSMENKFTKSLSYEDQYKHDYKSRDNIGFYSYNYRKYKYDDTRPPIDDYRMHKPGSFIPTRRHSYFPRDKYKNVGTRFYDEHNRRFSSNDHPIYYHENYQRDTDYQRNPRYHQRNIDYLRDDKPLRSDSYDSNFNNGEKRANIQQDYSPRNNRHDSHHMASDIKGNFDINRYHHSQIHRVYNPSNKYFHPKPHYSHRGYQNPRMKYNHPY